MLKINNSERTTFGQKIILVIFGLFLFMFMLESGLRLSGLTILCLQEIRNKSGVLRGGSYRIMCLGESTTAGQYAYSLERILNKRSALGVKFLVIDKGIPGTNTANIMAQLESWLEQYDPDMVIAMMGINDNKFFVAREPNADNAIAVFLKPFRIYKLANTLWLNIAAKFGENYIIKRTMALPRLKAEDSARIELPNYSAGIQQVNSEGLRRLTRKNNDLGTESLNNHWVLDALPGDRYDFARVERLFKKAIANDPGSDWAYLGLGRFYVDQGWVSRAEEMFKKVLSLNPGDYRAYLGLAKFYRDNGTAWRAEEMFKKALELNPEDPGLLVEFGSFYIIQGEYSKAERLFKKAIANDPGSDWAYSGSDRFYVDQGWVSRAEEMFKKVLSLNSGDYRIYLGLAKFYRDNGTAWRAEEMFKKALELNPEDPGLLVEFGSFYIIQGKYSKAEALLNKARKYPSGDNNLYGVLGLLYAQLGRHGLSEKYYSMADKRIQDYFNPETSNNYRKLRRVLGKRGIKLVCAQYPLLSVEPLKAMFGPDKGVIFVDNEGVFREALMRGSYREYFRDMFGGSFGHCTPKGNNLLAGNIAKTILKEVFGK